MGSMPHFCCVFSYRCTHWQFASVLAEPAEAQCDVLMGRRQHKHSCVLINRFTKTENLRKSWAVTFFKHEMDVKL